MPTRTISSPTSYVTVNGLAIGREGFDAQPIDLANPLPVTGGHPRRPTYRSGVVAFTPVAGATDIIALAGQNYGRVVTVESITVSGTAASAAVLDVLVQRSSTGGGGTFVVQPTARHDLRDRTSISQFYAFTANRTSNGNGIDSIRPLLACGKLHLGTASIPGNVLNFKFDTGKRPLLRDLNEWLVVNLNGQTIPAGCQLDVFVEWTEEALPPVQFVGDSTTSNASTLFSELVYSGAIPAACNLHNSGSNGHRLEDALLNLNGVPYPLVGGNGVFARMNGMPAVMVLCYGLNDLRQGARTRDQMISMLDAAIHATLNGTVSGATYTSTLGAGTSFTWTANSVANPDARIILWGPNSLATDGNGTSFITLTGRFASGYTVAQAAQEVTDDLYFAHAAFANDPRVYRVVQKQDVFGRTCVPMATSGLMSDIGHPNARGQTLSARQISPVLRDALASAHSLTV